MTRRFWVVSAIWILVVVATAPLLIEVLDDAGLGVSVPGLSVTGGEILLAALLAAVPPLLVALFVRRRSRWMKHYQRVIAIAFAMALSAVPGNAQRPEDSVKLAFASASVKRSISASSERQSEIRLQPKGRFSVRAATLRELIAYAYQRHPFDDREVMGGPPWIDSTRFDISATAAGEHSIDSDGAARKTWAMLRTLLTERFQLRVEEKEIGHPVYVLMRATSTGQLGPRIQRTAVDCGALMRRQAKVPEGSAGPPCSTKTPPGLLVANTVTMPMLASMLSSHVDRPVMDGTGLAGRYDVQLQASDIQAPSDYRPGPSDIALPRVPGPSIFVAVRLQLGLKLEPKFAPLPVVVVHHAEQRQLD